MRDEQDTISLRSPTTEEELERFYGPLMEAFAEDRSAPEQAAERPMVELDRMVNAITAEGRLVGSAGATSMRLTVPGGATVAAAGIKNVGVIPDHRRRGILTRMMRWMLDDAIARSEPVAMLWASEAAIYQRFGFGSGTQQSTFEAPRDAIAFRDPLPARADVTIRSIDEDESMRVIPPLFEKTVLRGPGGIGRPEAYWQIVLPDHEWTRGGNGPKRRAVIEVDGEPRGYVLFRVKSDWTPTAPDSVVHVVEIAALEPELEQRLWAWLASIDLVRRLRVWRGPMPHPLMLQVLDPRRLAMSVTDGLWLRLVDVPAALEARRYAGEGRLVVELRDGLIDSNAGRWRLTVRADGTAVVRRTTVAPDLVLDVSALACVYLGAWRWNDLARAGRVVESRRGALDRADALFETPTPPFANTMF